MRGLFRFFLFRRASEEDTMNSDTRSPVQRGSDLYERLTDLSPDEVSLEELMTAWDMFAEDGPWEMTRAEAEEDLGAFLESEQEARDVKDWREARDLTQAEAADIAGVDLRSWQRWEYGERRVPQWLADVLRQRHGSSNAP